MSLNIASRLIVCILTILVAETSLGLFFEATMDSTNEVQNSKEGGENIVGHEHIESQHPQTDKGREMAQLHVDWLHPPIDNSQETNRGREHLLADNFSYKPDYKYSEPDYKYDEENQTENERFEEEWKKGHVMEISEIGRSDPSLHDRDEDIKRWIPRRLYKRAIRRPFNRTVGCNKLPSPPHHSSGECQHNSEIAKCWISCHRFYKYLDNARQKMFLCLDGNWKPEELPHCLPYSSYILCEEKYISGNNMNSSCVEDGEMMKCTATCESNFKFQDGEVVKVIVCQRIKGVDISRTKFPDCHSE